MTTHLITLLDVTDYDKNTYGITYRSAYVYRSARSSGPTRIVVWNNTGRPNPHPGEVRHTAFGTIGGDGIYLDPHNKGTDSPWSVLISPEASVVSAHGNSTGSEASGQVYARNELRDGDRLVLVYPDGTEQDMKVSIGRNSYGRGVAVPIADPTSTLAH